MDSDPTERAAFLHELLAHDRALSLGIAAWGARQPYRLAAWAVARTGDSLVWLVVCGLLLWQKRPLGPALLLAVVVSALGTAVAKGIFKRQRPAEKWAIGTDKYAFPSGHAARAGAVAVTLAFAQPALSTAWLLWAALVALARVALSRHYVSDVLSGLLFGATIGLVLQLIG